MKYYCIKQHDITDCGAACLATISKQYGLKLPISKIREIAGTDKQGTNAYGMVRQVRQGTVPCLISHNLYKAAHLIRCFFIFNRLHLNIIKTHTYLSMKNKYVR